MANEIFSRFIGIRYLRVYTTIHTMETLQYTHLSAPSRSVSTHARSIFHETRTTSQFFPSIFDESSRNRSTIEDATTRMIRRRATWKILFVQLRSFSYFGRGIRTCTQGKSISAAILPLSNAQRHPHCQLSKRVAREHARVYFWGKQREDVAVPSYN